MLQRRRPFLSHRRLDLQLSPDTKSVLDKGYVRLVDTLGSDLSVVNAARVSYDKESGEFSLRDEKLLAYLLKHGHTSPLRHCAMTFEVYAPLLVARQWWKCAVSSTHVDDQNGWNESSRRYVTENEEYYIPQAWEWRSAPATSKQGSGEPLPFILSGSDDTPTEAVGDYWTNKLLEVTESGQKLYQEALEAGVAPELARLFIPAYALYVRWRWTASLAAVFNFLDQRLEHDAQYEIQKYAQAVRDLTVSKFPKTMEARNECR